MVSQRSLGGRNAYGVETFVVVATIRNNTSSNQTITVWTNEGWPWVVSNPELHVDTAALQNFPTRKTLAPGQALREAFSVMVDPKWSGLLVFRVGFVPNTPQPRPVSDMASLPQHITWSNLVVIR